MYVRATKGPPVPVPRTEVGQSVQNHGELHTNWARPEVVSMARHKARFDRVENPIVYGEKAVKARLVNDARREGKVVHM